ncbi:MAG: type II toxin-antitoxin system HicA family toxin [Desulfobacterales bacterium]
MNSRTIIAMLRKDGWYKAAQYGSHMQFKHREKKGRITVPHPTKDIPTGTLRSIARQSGVSFR